MAIHKTDAPNLSAFNEEEGLPPQPSSLPNYDPVSIEAQFRLNPLHLMGSPKAWKMARQFTGRFFTILFFFLKILFYAWADRQIWTYIGEEDIERAQSIRRHQHARWVTETLLSLGPTFIKVGQSISTRVDLIRKEYIEELSELQDRVPPFPYAEVHRILTAELGKAPEEVFTSLDPKPLAAASLGQVHLARMALESGLEKTIVLKVQRPNLIETFNLDLAIMRRIARFLQANTELGRGREWVQIVDEFGRTLFEEIDYIQEGRNADAFRKNFGNQPHIHIPEVYWRYTSRRVIALEYCPGIKVNDIHAIELRELDREWLAVTCVKAYFQQILIDGFYHADPHPGNIAVQEDGRIVFYDFGMVGRLPEKTRLGIVDAFLNIIHKKPDHLLNNLIELDMIGPNADLDIIRQLIVWALDNYYDVPHDQLNFEQLADELSELMYAHPFKLPASFTFMIRALLTLEGVATTLYPPIQFMGIAVDYAQNFIGQSFNFDFLIKKGKELLGVGPEKTLSSNKRNIPRVRLQHDEWTPIARYIKAAFILMGLGQLMSFFLFFVVMSMVASIRPVMGFWTFGFLVFICVFYGLLLLTTLSLLPSRKKPLRFEPMPTKQKR